MIIHLLVVFILVVMLQLFKSEARCCKFPFEVAEERWDKSREAGMDASLAFEVQDVPLEAVVIYP